MRTTILVLMSWVGLNVAVVVPMVFISILEALWRGTRKRLRTRRIKGITSS